MTAIPTRHVKRPRDIRLDFFRGLCLIIIFIAHIWENPWAQFIPARFGFSDATEIFVFCSGMASAVAFGAVFTRHGILIGCARVAFRCWQVYWAHISTFLVAAAVMIAIDKSTLPSAGYVAGLGLSDAFDKNAQSMVLGLLTLTFVPDYFNILPMYLIILGMMPLVLVLAHFDKRLAALAVAGTWLVAATGTLDLPAVPWNIDAAQSKTWFFNPFSWQLIFYTGFAFATGWIAPPPIDKRLVATATVVLVSSVPFSWHVALEHSQSLQDWSTALVPWITKTHFGLLRFVHFLALAYLAYVAAGERGCNLRGWVVEHVQRIGQQSLAIFVSGLVLSFIASVLLNLIGRGFLSAALVNIGGIAILYGLAQKVAWFKSSPWQKGLVGSNTTTERHRTDSATTMPRVAAVEPGQQEWCPRAAE